MKKTFSLIIISLSLFSYEIPNLKNNILAFPSAEGEGKYTVGGRGGKVLFVTNLNSEGKGSLREACENNASRMILFRIGGTIDLKGKNIIIRNDNITIAGQTATGDGIQIKNGGLSIQANEVIIRYLRIRPGPSLAMGEALDIKSPNRHQRKKNIIIDHVSAFWGVDETLNGGSFSNNVTVQWSIVAEGLHCSNYTNQGKGESWKPCKKIEGKSIWAHSRGSMITSDSRNISFHHNLIYRNYKRNPLIQSSDADIVNNVLVNYQYQAFIQPFQAKVQVNFIGNYFRSYLHKRPPIRVFNYNKGYDQKSSIYYKDNYDATFRATSNQPETDIRVIDSHKSNNNPDGDVQDKTMPHLFEPINIQPVHLAYNLVLNKVGANYPKRDSTDQRIIDFIRSGKAPKTFVNDPKEVGGWPVLKTGPFLEDNDNDGIPDSWEKANNLDSHKYKDNSLITNSGYTNLEIYLNSLVDSI
jgi:pectate lyase